MVHHQYSFVKAVSTAGLPLSVWLYWAYLWQFLSEVSEYLSGCTGHRSWYWAGGKNSNRQELHGQLSFVHMLVLVCLWARDNLFQANTLLGWEDMSRWNCWFSAKMAIFARFWLPCIVYISAPRFYIETKQTALWYYGLELFIHRKYWVQKNFLLSWSSTAPLPIAISSALGRTAGIS